MALTGRTVAAMICVAVLTSPSRSALPSRRACTSSTSSSATLPLSCPVGHVIHVLHWLTSLDHKGDIRECIAHPDCSYLRDSGSNGLLTVCNGLRRCNDTVFVSARGKCPNGTMPRYFQVQYECIPDNSTVTLCSDDIVTGNPTSLYVKTPAFPDGSDVTNRTCTCQVQGQGLSVTVLQFVFPNNTASLSISNSTAELWRYSFSAALFNRQVVAPGPQDFLNISFHDHGAQRQRAWLQVSASSGSPFISCGTSIGRLTPSQPWTTAAADTRTSSTEVTSPGTEELQRSSIAETDTTPALSTTSALPASASSSVTFTEVSTSADQSETTLVCSCCSLCQESQKGGAGSAPVAVLSVLCVLLAVALVVSNLYHLRGRLCRGRERDPTYAQREAPVPEDTSPYTELRIYQNRAMALTNTTPT